METVACEHSIGEVATHSAMTYIGSKMVMAWPSAKENIPGYAVKYPDGYLSWSPKDTFETAYKPLDALGFSQALFYLTEMAPEGAIQRAGWNGKDLKVKLLRPDEHSKMTLPYLYIEYPDGARCPWLASQTDILSHDWIIL